MYIISLLFNKSHYLKVNTIKFLFPIMQSFDFDKYNYHEHLSYKTILFIKYLKYLIDTLVAHISAAVTVWSVLRFMVWLLNTFWNTTVGVWPFIFYLTLNWILILGFPTRHLLRRRFAIGVTIASHKTRSNVRFYVVTHQWEVALKSLITTQFAC